MKILSCEQGSQAWFDARCGIPTASQFGRLMGKSLKPTAAAEGYAVELLTEWMLGSHLSADGSGYMERGREMEEQAVAWYELDSGHDCTKVGLVLSDDGTYAASPDRLIGDDGGLEVKCPGAKQHMAYLLGEDIGHDYRCQVQGNLWLTNREWWDFVIYNPVMPPIRQTVVRDETFIAALAAAMDNFQKILAAGKARLSTMGYAPELPTANLQHVVSDILA